MAGKPPVLQRSMRPSGPREKTRGLPPGRPPRIVEPTAGESADRDGGRGPAGDESKRGDAAHGAILPGTQTVPAAGARTARQSLPLGITMTAAGGCARAGGRRGRTSVHPGRPASSWPPLPF